MTRSVPILTSKSAPGVIIAMGTIGTSLKGHPGVFLSRDAGLTWRQVSAKHVMEASGSNVNIRRAPFCYFLMSFICILHRLSV